MTDEIKALVEEGTFQFSIGDSEAAVSTLRNATAQEPAAFEAWHALAEVLLSSHDLRAALAAAEAAHALRPDDLFINTTLSRIWMELGDKATAEKFGARAKVLGWKEELKSPPPSDPPFVQSPPVDGGLGLKHA
jgi:Flp pilus assembly protein TadD